MRALLRQAMRQDVRRIVLQRRHSGPGSAVESFGVDGTKRRALPGRIAQAVFSKLKKLARLDVADRRQPQTGWVKLQAEARVCVTFIPREGGEEIQLARE